MAKPFDATLNVLIDRHLENWVAFLCAQSQLPVGPARLLDTDLSTTLQADRLILIDAEPAYLIHLELEASGALGMPMRLLNDNVNATISYKLPVWSIVILLRPSANPSDLTGTLEQQICGRVCHTFHYTVLRLWKMPFETMLNAGPGLVSLAMLSDEAGRDLPGCLSKVDARLRETSSTSKMREDDLSSMYFLLGLRYEPGVIQQIFRDFIMTLEDSSTYQAVLKKGEARGVQIGEARGEARGEIRSLRANVLRLGGRRLGPASAEVVAKVEAVSDLTTLEALLDRAVEAKTWAEVAEVL